MALEITPDGYVIDTTPGIAPETVLIALDELLNSLPNFNLLSSGMKNSALQGSRVPDGFGIWPGQPGYMETYDIYFAALKLIPFLQAQPVVTSAGSEGTSVSVKPTDWSAIIEFYRNGSSIIQATGNDVLRVVSIPDTPHVRKVAMRDRGGHYGDIDTDVG